MAPRSGGGPGQTEQVARRVADQRNRQIATGCSLRAGHPLTSVGSIAATTAVEKVPLLTLNLADFRIIDDLVVARTP